MPNDVPDWSQAVTAVITNATLTVSGTVAVSSGTVTASITNATIPVSGSVAVSSGTVDISSGDVTVENKTGTVIQTGDRMDQLADTKVAASGTYHRATVTIPAATVKHTYSALVVNAYPAGAVTAHCVEAISNATGTGLSLVTSAPMGGAPGTSIGGYQGVVPVPIDSGKEVKVSVYVSSNVTVTVVVYGLTANPGVQLRADGRAYPLGSLSKLVTTLTAGTGTVLSSTASPLRYMVKSVMAFDTATGSFVQVTGTVGGSTVFLAVAGKGQTALFSTPSGLLCDINTRINYYNGSAHYMKLSVSYDLVV